MPFLLVQTVHCFEGVPKIRDAEFLEDIWYDDVCAYTSNQSLTPKISLVQSLHIWGEHVGSKDDNQTQGCEVQLTREFQAEI